MMRQHQSEPKKPHTTGRLPIDTDPFSSPNPTKRNPQLENSAPFLNDLSPFTIPFMMKSQILPMPENLELINTPLPNIASKISEKESIIDEIIKNWENQVLPEDIDGRLPERSDSESSSEDNDALSDFEEEEEDEESSIQIEVEAKTPHKQQQERKAEIEPEESSSEPPPPTMTSLKVQKKSQQNPQMTLINGVKKVCCNCKKTKCLKLYCDCFRINQSCDGCNCVGCHNTDQYEEQRNNAILTLMERNQQGFKPKIVEDRHSKGCNCKKSGCLKKYCECYQAGLKCCDTCKCEDCMNKTESHDHKEEKRPKYNKQFVKESPVSSKYRRESKASRSTAKKQGRFQQQTIL